jgi:hypothetical protein
MLHMIVSPGSFTSVATNVVVAPASIVVVAGEIVTYGTGWAAAYKLWISAAESARL